MKVVASGYGLLEAPVWHPRHGLYFSDLRLGGVHLLKADGTVSVVLPKRRGIGGMCLHEADGLVVSGRDLSYVRLDGRPGSQLAPAGLAPTVVGFNDLTADAAGRVYAGSLDYKVLDGEAPRPGCLYMVDLDRSVHVVAQDVQLSNGLCFSADGARLFHCDSRARIVRAYEVAPGGRLKSWTAFASLDGPGIPDGLKVAADGSVWVAVAHEGRIAVFETDGSLRENILFDDPEVTNLCFGGPDFRDLYAVSGSLRADERQGRIFKLRASVPGLPSACARVAIA